MIDITLAVILLPVLIFITLFARSCTAEYQADDFDDDVEYVSVAVRDLTGKISKFYILMFNTQAPSSVIPTYFHVRMEFKQQILIKFRHHLG